MSLNLVNDDQVVISGESRYVKMGVKRDLEEIYSEIMSNEFYLKYFYGKFEENLTLMRQLFAHIDEMRPAERVKRLSILPPIPKFLSDTKKVFLKINKTQFNLISKLARTLNTEMSNIVRILFFMSIPIYLYREFPYMLEHYRFTEQIINYYLEKTDGKERLRYYDTFEPLN
jgi:hypothetical protein